MKRLLPALALFLACGANADPLFSFGTHDGYDACAIYRNDDGSLRVNIPDSVVYQKLAYWTETYSGRRIRVQKYDVVPSLDGGHALRFGIRDTRRLESPMRIERSFASPNGDTIEVYTGGTSYRVVIYQIARAR